MKKLLSGLAVFMFVLVIMAGSASAAGVAWFDFGSSFDNIQATLVTVLTGLLVIYAVKLTWDIVSEMFGSKTGYSEDTPVYDPGTGGYRAYDPNIDAEYEDYLRR